MKIYLVHNKSNVREAHKKLITLSALSGQLRNETNVINPTITIEADIDNLSSDFNYFYIPKFGRYYFLTDIKIVRKNILEISGHCDVLSTAYELDNLKNCVGITKKQEKKYNLYINDGTFRVYQNPTIVTELFPHGFTSNAFVLAVAGKRNVN